MPPPHEMFGPELCCGPHMNLDPCGPHGPCGDPCGPCVWCVCCPIRSLMHCVWEFSCLGCCFGPLPPHMCGGHAPPHHHWGPSLPWHHHHHHHHHHHMW